MNVKKAVSGGGPTFRRRLLDGGRGQTIGVAVSPRTCSSVLAREMHTLVVAAGPILLNLSIVGFELL